MNNLFKDWYNFSRSSFFFFWQWWKVTVHIALNVVLKCQYLSQMVDFLEHSGMRFHIWNLAGFTVLLTVIFINSSSGTSHQWTHELHLHDGGIYLYIITYILSSSAKQISSLPLFLQFNFSLLTVIKMVSYGQPSEKFSVDWNRSLIFTSYGLFIQYN